MSTEEIPADLHLLLSAECAAEAHGTSADPDDLSQAVRLRWLERLRTSGPPDAPAAWLRAAVRAEARPVRRRARREVPLEGRTEWTPYAVGGVPRVLASDGHGDPANGLEAELLTAERRRALLAAVARLPGRCPTVLEALLVGGDRTYVEIAGELGISHGTIGPLRSRCLACLRRRLRVEGHLT